MRFYDFEAIDMDGNKVSMQEYQGKVVLVVNTASKCGLTPQFESLEKTYMEFKDRGFEILGFPCGQFAGQEYRENEEILSFCQLNYGVSFKMFEKIKVNGKDAHPLYKFLKQEQAGRLGSEIKWNFTKFLIDREGNVVDRFAPKTLIDDFKDRIREEIEK